MIVIIALDIDIDFAAISVRGRGYFNSPIVRLHLLWSRAEETTLFRPPPHNWHSLVESTSPALASFGVASAGGRGGEGRGQEERRKRRNTATGFE